MNAIAGTAAPAALERSPGYWATVLSRFLRDRVAVGAGLVILGLIAMALLGDLITPADPLKGSILSRLKPIGNSQPIRVCFHHK